ncbi:MAG: M28 family metallopeptidase [Spirochaetia bacterium]|nr:M28 family metallopeptidase [Spirochaetia bacterium]
MFTIPDEFRQFISPQCDRKSFIQEYLNNAGLDAPVIQLEDKNHIYVKFPQEQYNPMFKIKTVIAHYDRFEGTPGANDNSMAVFCLLEWAAALVKKGGTHNIRLIFTDGEEEGQQGVNQQGAFALAQLFKKLGIVNDDIFVFDSMGRGDVPVISQNDLPKGVPAVLAKRIVELENLAERIIKPASKGKWFKLHTSYSDNASFIVNGIPAVALTMLPSAEVSVVLGGQTPLTWKLFHTQEDNLESLTPESFEIFFNILNNLSILKCMKNL